MRLPAVAEHLLSELKARYELEVSGMHAGIRARLESRLALERLPIDGDLEEREGPMGLGRVRTEAYRSERLRKAVLSEIRLWPVVEGFALTLLPADGVQAPAFGADLMLLPARVAANADVYGPPAQTRGLLSPLHESFARLGGGPGPAWARGICAGEGLHARVSPRLVGEAFAALSGGLGAYLDVLAAAPSGVAPAPSHGEFFRVFHAHGPRHGPLRWLFGEAWAERYSRLMFE